MKVIPPIPVTGAILASTSVAEPSPGEVVYNPNAVYQADEEVIVGAPSSVVTITSASPCVVSWPNHNLVNGAHVTLSTTGALPAGLSAGTLYYVANARTDTFQLSTKLNGLVVSSPPAPQKWCWETIVGAASGMVGIAVGAYPSNVAPGAAIGNLSYAYTGQIYLGLSVVTTVAAYTAGDVIGVALDVDAGTCAFYKNGTLVYTSTHGLAVPLFPFAGFNTVITGTHTTNFGATPFVHTYLGFKGVSSGTPKVYAKWDAAAAGAGITLSGGSLAYGTATANRNVKADVSLPASAQAGVHTATAHIHRTYASLRGSPFAATLSVGSPCTVTSVAHGLSVGMTVAFTTTGALPTGVVAGTVYYVLAVTLNTFTISLTNGGAAVASSGTQSGVHTAISSPNKGNYPNALASLWWVDVGPTIAWAMFDLNRNSSTVAMDSVTTVYKLPSRIDSLGLVGLVAGGVRIEQYIGAQVYYDKTLDVLTRDTQSWSDYLWGVYRQQSAVIVFDLPAVAGAMLRVTFFGAGEVGCKAIIFGRSVYCGKVIRGPSNDGLNFSIIERDKFGKAKLIPRREVPKLEIKTGVKAAQVNELLRARADLNAVVALWSGLDDQVTHKYFEALLILGIYRQFQIPLEYFDDTTINFQLEEV